MPEAEAALQQAIQKNQEDVDAIVNLIVLNIILGKGKEDLESLVLMEFFLSAMSNLNRSLKMVSPEHPLLLDLQEKSLLFDQASAKYSAKVAG